jgi:hypothetical protein
LIPHFIRWPLRRPLCQRLGRERYRSAEDGASSS